MTLFSKRGAEPQALPLSDSDELGNLWSDLANNEAGRAACGWVEAPDAPAFDQDATLLAWTDGAWLVTPFPAEEITARLEAARAARLAELAALRWDRQQWLTFDDTVMPADDTTVGRCTAAEAYARNKGIDLDAPRNWKIADGVWTTLTTTAIIAYGIAIGDHMQGCFDREKALSDQLIAAPDIASLRAIDITAGWPA
ncbi:DUF4376 domain-containing protein [Sphingomonas sp. PR090111-T3T-6A]|uniref:DUF4376 domain-containing protein n=1 Tax=Sphingomonas sp. PR090111-T3T-6A TaxID=685778 RepID=UPI000369B8AB|nr:DUF4376 domain-containing protein [Sphingomonas sp. PR090111-T3T-6A]